jgi:hypothetical protein
MLLQQAQGGGEERRGSKQREGGGSSEEFKFGCMLEAPFQQTCADHFPDIDLLVVRAGDANPVAGMPFSRLMTATWICDRSSSITSVACVPARMVISLLGFHIAFLTTGEALDAVAAARCGFWPGSRWHRKADICPADGRPASPASELGSALPLPLAERLD